MVWAVAVPQPDILISGDGRNVAVRGRDGRLHVMRSGKERSLVKEWLAADADARAATDASLADGVSCDASGCVTPMAGGALVALALRPEALSDDCARAALIVTARQAPAGCAASVIDAERLRRQGALALRRKGRRLCRRAVKPSGIDRPWSPAAAADEGEATHRAARRTEGDRCDAVRSRSAGDD